MSKHLFQVAVLPGDGIGTEIMDACLRVLDRLLADEPAFGLSYVRCAGGAQHYADTGIALPDATMRACESADAILFGSMGLPHIRYPDGTEINPQVGLRKELDLYAGIRPIRSIPGVPSVLADPRATQIDFVLVREQSEGLFYGCLNPDKQPPANDHEAFDLGRVTRSGSERLFDFAFRLARQRREHNPAKGRVTCVDKANVLTSMAFFHKIYWERARLNPDIPADHCYVDAMALNLVKRPWEYDVVPTENQFGDILSDLGGGLIGGLGMAPSGDIGDSHALFQPSHGTAPDIAGQGKANPTAMILSAAMMLDWLGQRHGLPAATAAGDRITRAVDNAFGSRRIRTCEIGGNDGSAAVTTAILDVLTKADAA
ncbi:MAG: isocitrate/isopropylmalate dehydrogenase family protein [Rhodoplanes sp.]|uniref:isocitrate/isopropylmalate dehydrogenase family protein n=1 Tax=Rhodoplanes sp. TaxID=1968906 RepID=UPI001813079C|nr:isocitrate/isopropylmalate family dehydrogenase [Rhodoplanes sp.]NVO17494.1 isocitrate/isopropylmalate dehydrogenase family protein [Rhodoplanes sp.]